MYYLFPKAIFLTFIVNIIIYPVSKQRPQRVPNFRIDWRWISVNNYWFSFTRLCLSLWLIWFLCFRFDALTELEAFMRTEFLCISVLKVASGPRLMLASCLSALTPPPPGGYSTDRSMAVVPVLVLLFVALWFILRGDLFYVLHCAILFLCFSVLLALRLPRLGKRELILVLFVRLFDLRLFGFVCFLFLLVSGKSFGL